MPATPEKNETTPKLQLAAGRRLSTTVLLCVARITMQLTKHQGTSEHLINMNELAKVLTREANNLANQTPNIMSELIEKTRESKQTLNEVVEGIGHSLENLKPMKKEMIEELRGLRMTSTTEVAAMLKPLEDLRKFFLGDQHTEEVAKLKEFVELCERLERLKKSGFLDTVADTMLKLA
jgi:hypothetical protein